MAPEYESQIGELARIISRAGKNVFFTGAGISTESGIPDYRSSGGIWERHRPVNFQEFMSSHEARVVYWRQKVELYRQLQFTRPNAAHLAIARLCSRGLVEAVITQNIDGLHQASGVPDEQVIELHGNSLRVRCMSCGEVSPFPDAVRRVESGDEAPQCRCGGFLKPDTVSFGQAMPEKALGRAVELSRSADCFIVVGSTLVVQPAAHLPRYAKQAGARLAIVTLSETPLDHLADVRISCRAGEVLQALADAIESGQ
ncbi:MAG TPA: NAD-dependent deacylase [Deltaproteobacteria bacterium]|nr:NAD-dependent deacylase [Deltaproteobacteria bacterium]MDI9542636.1 NAD-dependent deacylase [Pseudomonadota bacterium]HPA83241.1 NAD-dependent deacylase [Deltaproteobacteria bacterium]HQO79466.1 NAD-dependent deacylase [Deltaproteobacteria bacterium]HQQ14362.1 NAD-dependent deacylase [Deltaproteobacteria bacterium]